MSPVLEDDLLILATERVVVQRFAATTASVEIRLDSRRMERRRAADAASSDERRRRDRRAHDVSDQLRTMGWAFIPAAQRRLEARPHEESGASPDFAEDESSIRGRLSGAVLCPRCLARASSIPLYRVERVLDRLQHSGDVRMMGARCEDCRKTELVYTLGQS